MWKVLRMASNEMVLSGFIMLLLGCDDERAEVG